MAQLFYHDGKVRPEASASVWDSYTSVGLDLKVDSGTGSVTLFTLSMQVGEALTLLDDLKTAIRKANPEIGFKP